jgi:hypothetical protein
MFDASPPTGDSMPKIDVDLITKHVEMIHSLAASCAGNGILIVAAFGEDPDGPAEKDPKTGKPKRELPPRIFHAQVGDIKGTVREIVGMASERHRNVYMPMAVFRRNLPSSSKGAEADIVAVLGIVGDFDDPQAAHWPRRIPAAPQCVLETSAGRFQTFYCFDQPEPLAAAKPVAERLKALVKCDSGTSDMSHVWRVPGCRNWPNSKKVVTGRSRQPQPVLIARPWQGDVVSLEDLAAAVSAGSSQQELTPNAKERDSAEPYASTNAADQHRARSDNAEPNNIEAADATLNDAEFNARLARIMAFLPNSVCEKIRNPPAGKNGTSEIDRSADLFSVIAELVRHGHDDAIIERIIRTQPTGIGAKYVGRSDLKKEIARVRRKISGTSLHHS